MVRGSGQLNELSGDSSGEGEGYAAVLRQSRGILCELVAQAMGL